MFSTFTTSNRAFYWLIEKKHILYKLVCGFSPIIKVESQRNKKSEKPHNWAAKTNKGRHFRKFVAAPLSSYEGFEGGPFDKSSRQRDDDVPL